MSAFDSSNLLLPMSIENIAFISSFFTSFLPFCNPVDINISFGKFMVKIPDFSLIPDNILFTLSFSFFTSFSEALYNLLSLFCKSS